MKAAPSSSALTASAYSIDRLFYTPSILLREKSIFERFVSSSIDAGRGVFGLPASKSILSPFNFPISDGLDRGDQDIGLPVVSLNYFQTIRLVFRLLSDLFLYFLAQSLSAYPVSEKL